MRFVAGVGPLVVLAAFCVWIAGCDEVGDGTAGTSWTPLPPPTPVVGDWPQWRPAQIKEFVIGRGKAVAKDNGVEIQIDYSGSNKPGPYYLIVDDASGFHEQFNIKLSERGTIRQVIPLQLDQLPVCCYIGLVSVRNGKMVGMSNRLVIQDEASPPKPPRPPK